MMDFGLNRTYSSLSAGLLTYQNSRQITDHRPCGSSLLVRFFWVISILNVWGSEWHRHEPPRTPAIIGHLPFTNCRLLEAPLGLGAFFTSTLPTDLHPILCTVHSACMQSHFTQPAASACCAVIYHISTHLFFSSAAPSKFVGAPTPSFRSYPPPIRCYYKYTASQ